MINISHEKALNQIYVISVKRIYI